MLSDGLGANVRSRFIHLYWLPLAALAAMYLFRQVLFNSMGYGLVAVPFFIGGTSVCLGVMGIFSLRKLMSGKLAWRWTLVATVIAVVPALALTLWLFLAG